MPEELCVGGAGPAQLSVTHRWVELLSLDPLSSSQGSSESSESRRPYGAARQPEMLRTRGRTTGSGSGAGSSDRGKLRRSHGATV